MKESKKIKIKIWNNKLGDQENFNNLGLKEGEMQLMEELLTQTNGEKQDSVKFIDQIPQTVKKSDILGGHRVYAARAGLAAQRYDVETQDGYILGLYRIYSKDCPMNPALRENGCSLAKKRPILLQHGLISDGTFFMM